MLDHPFRQDPDYRAFALNNIGQVHAAKMDWQEAIIYYERALSIWREEGRDREGLTVTLLNIGRTYARKDQPQRGIEYLQESLSVARDLGISDL